MMRDGSTKIRRSSSVSPWLRKCRLCRESHFAKHRASSLARINISGISKFYYRGRTAIWYWHHRETLQATSSSIVGRAIRDLVLQGILQLLPPLDQEVLGLQQDCQGSKSRKPVSSTPEVQEMNLTIAEPIVQATKIVKLVVDGASLHQLKAFGNTYKVHLVRWETLLATISLWEDTSHTRRKVCLELKCINANLVTD